MDRIEKRALIKQLNLLGITKAQNDIFRLIYTTDALKRYAMAAISEAMHDQGTGIRLLPIMSQAAVQEFAFSMIGQMELADKFYFEKGFIIYDPRR